MHINIFCEKYLISITNTLVGDELENSTQIFEDLIREGISQIDQWIADGKEENLFLDFKEKTDASKGNIDTKDREIYSKALSGFSNSIGGVIVWGVEARQLSKDTPDVAVNKKPISNVTKFLTDLNSTLPHTLVPSNKEINNQVVFSDKENDIGFVITHVPQSDLPPHEAVHSKHLYYIRSGDSFLRMEHYQLEDTFGKRYRPKLDLKYRYNIWGWNGIKDQKNLQPNLEIIFLLNNIGRHIAKYPAARIKISPSSQRSADFGGGLDFKKEIFTQKEKKIQQNGFFFVGNTDEVIHPSTEVEIGLFKFKSEFNMDQIDSTVGIGDKLQVEYILYAENMIPMKGNLNIEPYSIRNYLFEERKKIYDY